MPSSDAGGTVPSRDASPPEPPPSDFSDIAQIGRPDAIRALPDGSWAVDAFSDVTAVGPEFYRDHGDDYDFLAVYTEGQLPDAFAWAVSLDDSVRGLWPGSGMSGGVPGPADAGSAGRLQQINMMNAAEQYAPAPSDADILVHETAHRWAAFIELPQPGGNEYLHESPYGAHWTIHVHTGGPSALGYGDLIDLGGGRFRFEAHHPLSLSPLELYLAGLIGPDEVPPLFFVRDARDYDPASPPYGGTWGPSTYGEPSMFSGTRVDFTISDVVSANGARLPSAASAQRMFRFAFLLVCADEGCDASNLAIVEAQRQAFPSWFERATGGRATVETTLD